MREDLEKFQSEKAELENRLAVVSKEVDRIRRNCKHEWEVKYTPEHHEGYRIQGDPPGTMGVDRQLPFDVPSKTIRKWTRHCRLCGLEEITTFTKKVLVHRDNGCVDTQEVPEFSI